MRTKSKTYYVKWQKNNTLMTYKTEINFFFLMDEMNKIQILSC